MILYHGSNVEVKSPRLISSERRLDFGDGFYLTGDLAQALRWAELTASRKSSGSPIVSVFEVSDASLALLKVKRFDAPNAKWLKYVACNRRNIPEKEPFDVVTGPVANDRTSPTISMFLSGMLTLSETIRRLRPQQLKDQYAFKTVAALKLLKYLESITR